MFIFAHNVYALLFCAGLIGTGCAAHRPITANWRLTKQGGNDVLIPPGVAKPDLARRTFALDLAAGHGACPPVIRVKGKRVFVTVTRDTLLRQPAGWLTAWAAGIESQDCIAPGEGSILALRVAESLPLDPDLAFHLLYPNNLQTGQVDIAPPVRLQVVSPFLRDGVAPDAPILETTGSGNSITVTVKATDNLIGYETAWYGVRPRTHGTGFSISPLYTERHVNDTTERRAQPATDYLQFSADAAFYRLFYKSGQTDFTAFVVAAPTRAELDRRTAILDTAAASCAQWSRGLCVAIPRRVAINPMVPVTVNGVEVMVAWGANVAGVIRNAGERQPETVLPGLAISRFFNGRPTPVDFDRSSPSILRLNLTGGENISWKQQ
ncbi:MAG TPA: hypothetical protein VHY84_20245 [Bryobacteraceae bacterium]|nr:hypothetical protein [Bryobacteraceae bacterium]